MTVAESVLKEIRTLTADLIQAGFVTTKTTQS